MNSNVKKHFLKEKYADSKIADVKAHLNSLGVAFESMFAEFFLLGKEGPYFTDQNTKELDSLEEIVENTDYVVEEFQIPASYISLGSTDGESLLLYRKNDEAVFYIDWNQVDLLQQGRLAPDWRDFDEYLNYYFS